MLIGLVNDVLVDLIGNHIGIILLCQIGNDSQLFPGEHAARGVGGIADHNGLGMLPECVFQLFRVKGKGRCLQLHINRHSAGQNGVCAVVLIERGENNHFIAGVADGHHSAHHSLSAAASDQNLRIGVNGHTHKLRLFYSQCLAEILSAPGNGILVRADTGDFCQTVGNGFGRVEVRKSLRQVHCVILQGNTGHTTNQRIRERIGTGGKLLHNQFLFSLWSPARSSK